MLFNKLFPIVDMCLSCEDIGLAREICAIWYQMTNFWTILRPVFSASRAQRNSDLHYKFALRLHHVWQYGRHSICDG